METLCSHLTILELSQLKRDARHVCPERLALGDTWVHLRICQGCGHVGCCDDSRNKHATKTTALEDWWVLSYCPWRLNVVFFRFSVSRLEP